MFLKTYTFLEVVTKRAGHGGLPAKGWFCLFLRKIFR